MHKLKMHSVDGVERNIDRIGELFPNAVTEVVRDGKVERAVDFDVLRQELSGVIVEGREERYQFTWPDKRKAILAANAPVSAAMRPVKAESVGRDGTPGGFDSENLYIEGDNLEVLKLLRETYLGKVKMIYIDPPYNTGGDLIYNDDFAVDKGEYMANSGQFDEEGNRMEKNPESNGRFHTDWLNMIYPRLKVAKDLLADDGVVFISIDDNEQENLKKICNELFGANNFIAQVVWQKRTSPDARRVISAGHDYILAYVKNETFVRDVLNSLPFDEKDYARYKNPDNDPNGPWISTDCTAQAGHGTKEQFYDMKTPSGRIIKLQPGLCWRYTQSRMKEEIEAGHIWFGINGQGVPRKKTYLADIKGKNIWTCWTHAEVGHTQEATKEVATLLNGTGIMDFPKPVRLMRRLTHIATNKNSLILDFFSGSVTTAHAVMQLNAEDGGSRKFIMVQLPEVCAENSEAYKAGYKNICEIGKERIRRAGKKIREENPLTTQDLDIGFRCLRLDTSNMKDVYYRPEELKQDDLFASVDNVKEDRTPEDLLFQVMLELGAELSAKIETAEIAGKKVFNVADNYLIACFDTDVADETVKAVAQMKPQYAVFRDSSMKSDSVAANFEQIFKAYSPDTKLRVL